MATSIVTSKSFATTAAISAAVASGIHLMAMPVHMDASVLTGSFFLGVAACQAVLAAGLVSGPSRRLVGAGILMTVSVLILWALSRTIGVPPGAVERISAPDLTASAAELITVAALTTLWLRRPARWMHPRPGPATRALVMSSAIVAALVFWSPLQAGAHGHAEPTSAPAAEIHAHDAAAAPHGH